MATFAVVGLGFFLEVSSSEWLALVLAAGLVWSAEAINTAIESVCDLLSPEVDTRVARAKDAAAAAVLVASLAALVVGLIVFVPRLLALAGAA